MLESVPDCFKVLQSDLGDVDRYIILKNRFSIEIRALSCFDPVARTNKQTKISDIDKYVLKNVLIRFF